MTTIAILDTVNFWVGCKTKRAFNQPLKVMENIIGVLPKNNDNFLTENICWAYNISKIKGS